MHYTPAAAGAGVSTLLNARNYGAVPDGVTDCSTAFQRALDAAPRLPDGTVAPVTLLIPSASQPYRLARPVFVERDYVTIAGEGPGSLLQVDGQQSAFLVSRLRKPMTPTGPLDLPADCYPDVTAETDKSLNRPVRGLRTGALHGVTLPGAPTDWGMVMRRVMQPRAMTIEFMVKKNDGVWNQRETYPLCGLLEKTPAAWAPAPWYVCVGAGTNLLFFLIQLADGAKVTFCLGYPLVKPWVRCSIQLDLKAGGVAAWCDGIQVNISHISGPDLTPDVRLWENNGFSFCKVGHISRNPAGAELYAPAELTWAGFRLGHQLRYAESGVDQKPIDGQPLSDKYRFFHFDGDLALSLDLNQTSGRLVPWSSPWGSGNGLFLSEAHRDAYGNAPTGVQFRDLRIRSGSTLLNPLILLGQVFNFRAQRVFCHGGGVHVGSLPIGIGYPVSIQQCDFLGASDACISGFNWIGSVKDSQLYHYQRQAMRFYSATMTLQDLFLSDSEHAEGCFRFHGSDNGGVNVLERILVDFEYESKVLQSYVDCEAEGYRPGSSLRIRDCVFGCKPVDAYVRLRGKLGPNLRPAQCLIDGLTVETTDVGKVVRQDGDAWRTIKTENLIHK